MTNPRPLFQLRPAQKEDAAAIKALIRAVNINPMGLKWQRFVVAVDENGRLLGCGQVKPHRDGSSELASIAVNKEWRNQGIARTLIAHLSAMHNQPLWLTCLNKLVPFYEKFGFAEVTAVSTMPPYFRQAVRFFRLYQLFSRGHGYLAVMVKPTEKT